MYIDLAHTVLSSTSSTVAVNHLPQTSSTIPVIQSPIMEHGQQNIISVLQSSSVVSIVSDTHTTTSPVTTLSVVECLTTSSSVVTSISGQCVSTVTTIAGTYTVNILCPLYTQPYMPIFKKNQLSSSIYAVERYLFLKLVWFSSAFSSSYHFKNNFESTS